MFRLFKKSAEEIPSPSSLRNKVIETVKELSPAEFTRPSLSHVTNNSYVFLSLITGTAANWACFTKDDGPCRFECAQFFNGYDLQGNLLNLLNQSSDIILTNATDCLYYRNDHEYFGNSGHGKSLCDLGYPRLMTPDLCIINDLQNNTPTDKVGTVEDGKNTTLIVAGGPAVGLFASGAYRLKKYLLLRITLLLRLMKQQHWFQILLVQAAIRYKSLYFFLLASRNIHEIDKGQRLAPRKRYLGTGQHLLTQAL